MQDTSPQSAAANAQVTIRTLAAHSPEYSVPLTAAVTYTYILCVYILIVIKCTSVRRRKRTLRSKISKERIHIISLQPISDSLKPKSVHELHVGSVNRYNRHMLGSNEGRIVWDCLNGMHTSFGLSR